MKFELTRNMNRRVRATWGALVVWLILVAGSYGAAIEELRVKRQEVFEFSEPPAITATQDEVRITFASRGYCDVTVAVEDAQARIVRHLANGLLGPTAPEPLAKNSLRQTLVWDYKNDRGEYVPDRKAVSVRVSLGLAPQFERSLFWEPKKRIGKHGSPIMVPRPEGVYVFEGEGVDHLRLLDHQGSYVRTIYPFPAPKLPEVRGLVWKEFPQDGQSLPIKAGPKHYSTLLTSGDNMLKEPGKYGAAASAMAVHDTRIALASLLLNRLSTDGSTGGLELTGPATGLLQTVKRQGNKDETGVGPRSAAFSPDGRWLYLTGFVWDRGWPGTHGWLHAVARLDYTDPAAKMEVFVGALNDKDYKTGDDGFRVPTCVACDAQGRVYVGDYMNDRIQVFSPEAKLIKSIPIAKPAQIEIHPQTGELYVFSWYLRNEFISEAMRIPATLTRLGPVDKPAVLAQYPLPLFNYSDRNGLRWNGLQFRAALDGYVDPPMIWLVPGKVGTTEQLQILRGLGGDETQARQGHIRLLIEEAGELKVVRDFGADTVAAVVRAQPPVISRQRMYVNPATGKLYVGEGDSGVMKSFKQLVEIDPATGQARLVELPLTAEDMCFDQTGLAYLRTDTHVVRYDPATWREVPWDYGEEKQKLAFDGSVRATDVVSALQLPAEGRPAYFHMGGMAISPRGHLAVACYNDTSPPDRREFAGDPSMEAKWASSGGRKYTPPIYPGRVRYGEVHVWDKHGQLVHEDAVPGLGTADGIGIDRNDNLYVLASAHRVYDGTPYFLPWTETLFKIAPSRAKLVSSSERAAVEVPRDLLPQRSPDMTSYQQRKVWLEGAEWAFGGVGFGSETGGCVCWNSRPALDDFARSFAPEIDHFSVAVLDTAGNLIVRVGHYGNVDDGVPLVAAGGPSSPRSVGGDEVALFHAAYLATDTDRRLFIADAGNRRIVSVRLDYHASRVLPVSEALK